MHIDLSLIVIIAAVLGGVYFYNKSQLGPFMPSVVKMAEAKQMRNYAYLLFALAVVVAVYSYAINAETVQSAGMWSRRARMCGAGSYVKARMCGASSGGKTSMCGMKPPMA